MVPDFMSQAPRPYILPSFTTGENGGVSHISSGPAGTTSRYPCRISDLPALVAGRYVPTTVRALEKSCSIGPKPRKSLRSSTSISQSSTSYPRRRKRSPIISWHGPSAPRVEGIATKSRVVASCASKLASTASRIFCLVSMAFIALLSCCHFQNRERANTLRTQTRRRMETRMAGNRNILYLIIGALIVAVGVLGYNLYQTKKQPEGLQINVGPNGLKIQNK